MTQSTAATPWIRALALGVVFASSTFVWAGPASATVDQINRGECSSDNASPVAQTQDPPGITDGADPDPDNNVQRRPLVKIGANPTTKDSENAFQDNSQLCPRDEAQAEN